MPASPGDEVRTKLEEAMTGWFDLRASRLVERALHAADTDQLSDDAYCDALFEPLLDVVETRYGREAEGWSQSTSTLLRSEFERQVEEHRQLQAAIEREG